MRGLQVTVAQTNAMLDKVKLMTDAESFLFLEQGYLFFLEFYFLIQSRFSRVFRCVLMYVPQVVAGPQNCC